MANLGEDLPDEIVQEMINRVDTDGDGKVGFEGTVKSQGRCSGFL